MPPDVELKTLQEKFQEMLTRSYDMNKRRLKMRKGAERTKLYDEQSILADELVVLGRKIDEMIKGESSADEICRRIGKKYNLPGDGMDHFHGY